MGQFGALGKGLRNLEKLLSRLIRQEPGQRFSSNLFQLSVLKLAVLPVVLQEDLLATIKFLFGNLTDILEKVGKWIRKVRFRPRSTLQ